MKHTITKFTILFSVITLIYGFTFLYDTGKVHLKVSKQVNGEKSVFEKTYENMEALKADEELKGLDPLVNDWIKNNSEGLNIGERLSGSTWISEDGKHGDRERNIIIKEKGNDEEDVESEIEKIIKIKTGDGEKVFTVTTKGSENHNMVFVDENGNKTELNEDTLEDMPEEGKDRNIIKRIEVITSDNKDPKKMTVKVKSDEDKEWVWIDDAGNETKLTNEKLEELHENRQAAGENHRKIKVIVKESESTGNEDIIIMNNKNEEVSEIEVEVEKEIGDDGEEVIKDKKVWITKNGEKVQIDDENAFKFKTEGDEITVIVDGKELDLTDFSEGEYNGDKDVFISRKSDGKGDIKQTMNVQVEKKHGETYIEIEIKRDESKNVTISEIAKSDNSLKDINFSIKNNLKPSELQYYPNPNDGKFNLRFNLDQKGEVMVKVLDILGNEVYKETILDFDGIYDNELNLTGREKGIYILQIRQGRKALSRKILIE